MRLIDADEVQKILNYIRGNYVNRQPKPNQLFWDTIRYIEKKVRSIPTAEVKEVVHGEWIFGKDHGEFVEAECSACNGLLLVKWYDKLSEYNYCPKCGADMRKKV